MFVIAAVFYSGFVSVAGYYIRGGGMGCYLLHVLRVILIKFLVVHIHLLQRYSLAQDVPAIPCFQRRSPLCSPTVITTPIRNLVWLAPRLLLLSLQQIRHQPVTLRLILLIRLDGGAAGTAP